MIEIKDDTYVVICKDDGNYCLATRRIFTDRTEAEKYASECSPSRQALVVPGRWTSLRLGERVTPGVPGRKTTGFELLRRGGAWLGAARNWLNWNTHFQDHVTWGSDTEVRPPMTFRKVEELAAEIAAAIWVEGAPRSVTEAAERATRWHYGHAQSGDGDDCVLVHVDDWQALRDAVRSAGKDPAETGKSSG